MLKHLTHHYSKNQNLLYSPAGLMLDVSAAELLTGLL
jgi:hypothetical protein